MPNDLIADGRNFYTEIIFIDFRSGVYGIGSSAATTINTALSSGTLNTAGIGGVGGAGIGAATGLVTGALSGGVAGAVVGAGVGAVAGGAAGAGLGALASLDSGFRLGAASLAAIRLPIPTNVNDTMTFNWNTPSARDLITPNNQLARAAAQGVGFLIGKTLNPLLFAAFNRPDFRSFKFEWVLAPRNKQESETIRMITQTFKHSASPSNGILMDYPYVAMVRMFPNNLNGHAIFKPMVVRGIGINLTPNPTPSFFGAEQRADGSYEERGSGAPTLVTLTVDMMEIKLWTREDIVI
jgi:hypothetical protein